MGKTSIADVNLIARFEWKHDLDRLRLHPYQSTQIGYVSARINLAGKAPRIVRPLQRFVGFHKDTPRPDHIRVLACKNCLISAGAGFFNSHENAPTSDNSSRVYNP